MRNASLETFGQTRRRKKMIQVKVREKGLVVQHPVIPCHIFLRGMKGKFHCAKED